MEGEFGAVVQRYRERAGLTQDELAERLQVTQQTVGKWESGKAYPRPGVFARLNQVLSIPAAEIMDLYGDSKGARSPSGPYSSHVLKQIGDDRKRQTEALSELAVKYSAKEKVDRLTKSANRFESKKTILAELKPLLEKTQKSFQWGAGVVGGSLAWLVDYIDKDVVAEFAYAESPLELSLELEDFIPKLLWNLATLRAHLRDTRSYLLIIIMPGYVGMDYPDDDPEKNLVKRLPNEVVLRRKTAEAALLGISIFVTNTPRQVIPLLASHGNEDIDT
ncbi:MAG: helix-turn-helix transcriptional regulator [Janthinobacterium svalbardensis]|uniref:HTH cro/C1-type domain-containing protein n=1 Tax=Janthinobacterium svalbardensis TaxID=368607 RepID=A0A290X085_9BURK|nr:helix-turn-helix domain-containing protein [Janthinobacterium svalbardensis]ATD62520.1 hypothetical protein CNX70_21995 [Janthinobacterium svalbardensis]